MSIRDLTRREFLKSAAAGAAALGLGLPALSAVAEAAPPATAAAGASTLGPLLNTAFPVPRRVLGKTGIEASILGYGSHISEEVMKVPGEREKQIQYALEKSINFFDIYPGPGPQFELMSKLLEPFSRDVIISMYMPNQRDPLGEFEKILKTFKRDHIDMVRMWTGGEKQQRPEFDRMYADMVKAKEQGKIRAIGVSAHREEYFLFELKRRQFDYALVIYNFHEHCNGYPKLVPIAKERGMALIGMKPFGMGSLIEFSKKARAEKSIKDIPDVSVPMASLRYVYQNPDISIAIPAMYSVPEIVENLKVIPDRALSAEERTLLERISKAAGPERCVSENWKV